VRRDPFYTQLARELRANPTDAESLLWSLLRAHKLDGHKFRRQYAVGQYIADFACRSQRLVIELDGHGHRGDRRKSDDSGRSAQLEKYGYRVLRFWNYDVLTDTVRVVEAIRSALRESSAVEIPVPLP
jgi:very-short-patch-repair endonuclease